MVSIKDEEIEDWILDKLSRKRLWGPKHTSIDNLHKGAPIHLAGKINEVAENLIKKGLIIAKPTHYGSEVSLNFARREEIFSIIEKWKLGKK